MSLLLICSIVTGADSLLCTVLLAETTTSCPKMGDKFKEICNGDDRLFTKTSFDSYPIAEIYSVMGSGLFVFS
ncbi:hypothetical protein D3C72_1033390 [compost metagenome]